MKWVKKFGGYSPEWNLELGDNAVVYASVFQDDQGEYHASYIGGGATYPATDTIEVVLADVLKTVAGILASEAKRFRKAAGEPVVIEQEPSNIEVVPGTQGKAGYGCGWLRVREGREVPAHYVDAVTLDDGRVAHIHPFVRAGDHGDLASVLGVPAGDRVAGVRWFDKA